MRLEDGVVRLSASDLIRFQSCAHATQLDLFNLKFPGQLKSVPDSEEARLVQTKGNAHERSFLSEIRSSGARVMEIARAGTFDEAVANTFQSMVSGADYVYQAALPGQMWGGYADFLLKIGIPSNFGDYSYEVIDTKLKRSVDPKHILQLVLYSDLLADVQKRPPAQAHLILGDGRKETLRLADYQFYARHSRSRLEKFTQQPWETRPEPVAACELCKWRDHCKAEWKANDSLSLVAGITRSQRAKLERAGVNTLTALSQANARVARLASVTFAKLQNQARMQFDRRQGNPPSFELKPFEPGRGLLRLPEPDSGDLFFDMEGDPHFEGGLEYLFGILGRTSNGQFFDADWAHDRKDEAEATNKVLSFFLRHCREQPKAHIYHYSHYEVTALKRLACSHSVAEAALHQLLREERFVDLYRVVQSGLYASEPGYSIKDLECFYMGEREGDIATAGASVVAYEHWRETGDQAILDQIRAYNETDCRSTELLRNWLIEKVRPANLPWYKPAEKAEQGTPTRSEAEKSDRELWQAKIRTASPKLEEDMAQLLFNLAFFHEREDKPAWWSVYDRAEREPDELIDDLDSLGGLEATGLPVPFKRSLIRTYRFPAQDTKICSGDRVKTRVGRRTVTVEKLSTSDRSVIVKFGPKFGQPPPDQLDLIPGGPRDNEVLVAGIRRVIESILQGNECYAAGEQLIQKHPPRFRGINNPLLEPSPGILNQTVTAIFALDSSILPIQGPPGTGKTYVSSLAIAKLIADGKRIAVSSNSHKAIDNLLIETVTRAEEIGIEIHAIKKVSGGDPGPEHLMIQIAPSPDDPRLFTADLVGGTAWLFARDDFDQHFDYLFIDEAGQVSLANTIAMSRCATNLVLVGDPMQLPQPIQGSHPGDSGLSGLEYLLKGTRTVSADRGIFLPRTRRMHPRICRYVSDLVYESRLENEPETANQAVIGTDTALAVPTAGMRYVPVSHEGNRQSSLEEVAEVAKCYERLLLSDFVNRSGVRRRIGPNDILVVAPYNAQVHALTEILPRDARVGTVDKFQGQEAAICLISFATSSIDEMPRSIEFLFNLNRLNVAVSRAQALSIVFASPRLLEIPCKTADQVRLVNAMCAISYYQAN